MKRSVALKLRSLLEQFAANTTTDNKTAYEGRFLFGEKQHDETFWDGHLIKTGTRIRWDGKLMAAAADLWAYPENDPDNAPNLWETIEYKDGYRVLTGPITASNPVQPGERCWENGVLYECITKGVNTYRPSEYMPNWQEATV